MSMLSAQCDELRERAATLRQGRWSDGADDARLMEDAAETILSLRDRAQDLQAENAKLRELVKQIYPKAKAFLQIGVQLGCNDSLSYDWYQQLHELGVEV